MKRAIGDSPRGGLLVQWIFAFTAAAYNIVLDASPADTRDRLTAERTRTRRRSVRSPAPCRPAR